MSLDEQMVHNTRDTRHCEDNQGYTLEKQLGIHSIDEPSEIVVQGHTDSFDA